MIFDQKIEQKDLKALAFKYIKYWYIFVGAAFIAAVAAFIYLRYATPIYSAKTTLLFKGEDSGGLSESAAFSDIELLNSSKSIDNEMLVLKSRSIMKKVIEHLNVDITFVIEGSVRDVEIFGALSPISIVRNSDPEMFYGKSFTIFFKDDSSFELDDGEFNTYRFGEEITKPYGKFTVLSTTGFTFAADNKPVNVKFHNTGNLAEGYSNKLGVKPVNNNASVLSLTMNDPVPDKATAILATLVDVYDEDNVNDKNQIAQRTFDFIDDRLTYLTKELDNVEANVEEFKKDKELADVGSQAQQYLVDASAIRTELKSLYVQVDVLRSIERYLNVQEEDEYEIVPSNLIINDATLNVLLAKFNELQLERERFLALNKPNNPYAIAINEQLRNLRNNILENLKTIKSGLQINIRSLQGQSRETGDQIQQVPVMDRQLIEITRQQEIKKALYVYLLQKKEEAALSLAATVSNSRIIDPPLSEGHVSPNKTNTMAYSILLGLFLPFLGIYIKNLLNNKVELRSEVEKLTETPILGEICHDETGDAILDDHSSYRPIVEMFRLIRTNLYFSAGGKDNKVLLVTSSVSGEGKTFFSVNMGISLAKAGKKVIIVEFDLRKPKLLKTLNLSARKGLTDYLIGDIPDVENVIFESEKDRNLALLSSGTLPPNPAELIMIPRVSELIAKLRSEYDYVILDSPPVGKVADSLNLSHHADTSIYIVRYNYTDKEMLKIVNDLYVNKKLVNPFIVLNDSKKVNSGYTYGYN